MNQTIKIKKKRIILMDDNDERRSLVERCQIKSRITINPIVDWNDEHVWDYLHFRKCNGNPLYQCGFGRVGCIGCPLASKHRWEEFNLYPKYKDLYIRAFDNMLKLNPNVNYRWKDGYDVFLWWMEENPNQLVFDEFDIRQEVNE